jgi:hypothetical protein
MFLIYVFSQVTFLIVITFFLTSYGVTDSVETRKIINLFILMFVQFFLFHNNALFSFSETMEKYLRPN